MNIIYYLIPVAILFMVIGVIAFFWATKSEQFEDLEKQGLSILMDDAPTAKSQIRSNENSNSSGNDNNTGDKPNTHSDTKGSA